MKVTFPHPFNTPNTKRVRWPATSSALLRTHSSSGTVSTQTTSLFFDCEIHEYCTADVALLKPGFMKFRGSFLADTGINPFRSCTIAGACVHVFLTSHMKEKTIARVLPNGYRGMRNYSNKSIGCITYCEKIGVRYKRAWSGGRCTKRMPSCGQTHSMCLDIIYGSVHFLTACTPVPQVLRQADPQHHTQQDHG